MALEYGLNGICIKHDIRIRRVIVHVDIELLMVAVFKGVAYNFILTYPFAEFYYRRLVRGEVDEAVTGEYGQHIKIIGQFPVHFVGLTICTQVWRIDEEHHTRHVLVLLKQLLIITGGNDQPVEVIATRRIVYSLNIVIKVSFSKSENSVAYFIENINDKDSVI